MNVLDQFYKTQLTDYNIQLEYIFYSSMEQSDFSYHQAPQSMYLSTLDTQKNIRPKTAVRDSLKVDDISGARPKFIEKPIKPRQTFNNCNLDIDKSTSKVLIPSQVNKPQFNMRIDDIQGARTQMNKFTTLRNTNPLNPVYELPQVQYYPIDQPKFIRDNMVTYDIDGTSTKESFAMRIQKEGKVLNSKQEILQAIQLKKSNHLRKSENTKLLDVNDICCKQNKIKGNRCTNPLEPQYQIPKSFQKGSYLYGQIEKSKPEQPMAKFNNPSFSLQTEDIIGARTKVNNFVAPVRQQINEAKVSSVKRGLSSNRKTNPLNPNYNYPGWSECHGNVGRGANERPRTAHQRLDAFIGK